MTLTREQLVEAFRLAAEAADVNGRVMVQADALLLAARMLELDNGRVDL